MTISNNGSPLDPDQIRSCNWSGSIPVILTLSPTSLGTTMMPHPIHLMLNRATFLHVGLQAAILRLHRFAPATMMFSAGLIIRNEPEPQGNDGEEEATSGKDAEDSTTCTSSKNDSNNNTNNADTKDSPVCWLEDEETQVPLRWHLFVGVLWDMLKTPKTNQSSSSSNATTIHTAMPWKIRLHFSHYPSSELLPLEPGQVETTIQRSFKNSLKQALFLQYGNSKVAMNMARSTHQRLWDSIESSNYKLYQQINADLQASYGAIQLIPIRLFVDSKPPLQKPCKEKDEKGNDTTLGSLLLNWLPELFEISASTNEATPKSETYRYVVAGIVPTMSVSIRELWWNLCHPDHFLYIVVLTR